jgi:hypothetical protein
LLVTKLNIILFIKTNCNELIGSEPNRVDKGIAKKEKIKVNGSLTIQKHYPENWVTDGNSHALRV